MTSREELELAREWVEHDRFIAERARFGTGDRPELPLSNRDAPASPRTDIEVSQNEFIPVGHREVNAIVTVTRSVPIGYAAEDSVLGQVPAVIFVIDCSESMAPWLDSVITAVQAAIGALRDGCYFAILAGREIARPVYPHDGRLAEATADSRAAANAAVDGLEAHGRRELGLWLTYAARMLLAGPGRIRHVVFVTGGSDGGRHPAGLAAAVRACAGIFTCDCRGVGTDWVVAQLRQISGALLGTLDIVADLKRLAAEMQRLTTEVMGRDTADVALRLWTPEGATVRFVRQVAPTLADLTGKRVALGTRTGDYPTGAWGCERRDFQICIDVPPGSAGQEKLAGRVMLVARDDNEAVPLGEGKIRAVWTEPVARPPG